MVEIKHCKDYNPIQLDQLIRLMSQLYTEYPALTADHFDQLLKHPTTKLFIAMESERIIGAITLAWYPIPTAMRTWIEAVVINKDNRGKKIGESLILHAIQEAKKSGLNRST